MKVVVTGGRDFDDIECVHRTLNALNGLSRITLLAHGGARGADTLCATWARHHGVECALFPAKWRGQGRAAGPIRNTEMLDTVQPDFVVVFPGRAGTADCKRKAEARGLNVIVAEVNPD